MCVFPANCRVAQMVSHLPFFHRADEFVDLVRRNQVVVVAGETGSGKSTIAPLALLESGIAVGGKIGVTESRVVVTKRLAKWVSKLDGTYLGEVVGYQVGMDKQLDELVSLVYETEGIVLNQMLSSPKLGKYKILVIDEVHERTINVDVLMARLKKILAVRGDLRVVIMSATMDVHRFSKYFDGAPIMQVSGRTFPLEIRYARETPWDLKGSVEACANKVVEILEGNELGDILCFLPDEDSIKVVIRLLKSNLTSNANVEEVRLLPLYGQQSEEEQDLAFVEEGPRRVILSTNIAETGVTVEGVVHVVDTGLIKQTVYISANMSGLEITEHSKAGCDQRAGRSARTQPGICHRLYTRENFESRVRFTEPEIRRSSLNQTLLNLRCGGISFEEILELEFMDAPELRQWHQANAYLKVLGAFDQDGNVTELGYKMHALHVDPMIAKIILEGVTRGCLDPILTIAAGLSVTSNLFPAPKDKEQEAYGRHAAFKVRGSDPLTVLKVYDAWIKSGENVGWARENFLGTKALNQMTQFRRQMAMNLKRLGLFVETESFTQEMVTKTVASGLIVNLAKHGYKYSYQHGEETVWIHPGSAANGSEFSLPEHVVFTLVMRTSKPFMRGVQTVPETWFLELVPSQVREHAWEIRQNYSTREWEFRHATKWNGIALSDESVTSWPCEAIVPIAGKIMEQVRTNSLIHGCHARIPELRKFYQELKQMLNIDWLDMARLDELEKKMGEKLVEKLANVLTVKEFVQTDLTLDLADFLTPELIQANRERLEARRAEEARQAEENRVYTERMRVFREAEETRRAAERAQDENVRGPLRKEVEELDRRLSDLGVTIKYEPGLQSDYSVVQGARSSTRSTMYSHSDAREYVRLYRLIVEREEISAKEKFVQTRVIYDQVLALMPSCPMCGNGWNQNHRCTTKHNANRIIPIPRREVVESIVGHFVTNKGEKVATLRIEGNGEMALFFVVGQGRVFTGKEFTSIAFEADQEILPEHLAQDADDIREFLADLEAQRAVVEKIAQEIADQRRAVSNGDVAVLVFDKKNAAGVVTATHGGTVFVAQYKPGELYPEIGDRWICRLQSQKKMGLNASGTCDAYPMQKLTGPVTLEDVRRSAKEIAGLFEGLPPTLLQ